MKSDFQTTQWSLVRRASELEGQAAESALGELCGRYWFPMYAYLRRQGNSAQQSEDLVQEFVLFLIEKNTLAAADHRRGRFRSFLLTALQNFSRNQRAKATTKARGGGRTVLSLDVASAEDSAAIHAIDKQTPEAAFEHAWALTVIDQAMQSLRSKYEQKGRADWFDAVSSCLGGSSGGGSYDQIAERFEMTSGAVRTAVHRLRSEYRRSIEEVVAETIYVDECNVGEELEYLLQALAAPH